jgi:hypothetical protein
MYFSQSHLMGSGAHITAYAMDFRESVSGGETDYSPPFTAKDEIA